MIIQIDPLDTLFFRDGKPFTMGDETWADATFPPYPSVIYGALRSAYFSNHINELKKANELDDPTKELKIKGIYYLIGKDIYFFLPADCAKEKDSTTDPIQVSVLSRVKNGNINGCRTDYILCNKDDKKVENIIDGLIGKSMFEKYLALENPDQFSVKQLKNFIIPEPKIGIGRSTVTHSTKEGKLYCVDMKRLKNLSLLVDFEGLDFSDNGLIKLGGEGKASSYKKYDGDINIDTPKFEQDENRFKIVLTTPAIFKNGWLSEWIDKNTLDGNYGGLKLKLLTAAIGKPVNIGGFDMKKRIPKCMYRAVPSGSVYYFKLVEGDMEKVVSLFHQKAISDIYPEQGFGIAYVGKILEGDSIL